jgi:hypothetical protein
VSFSFSVATAAPPPLADIVDHLGDGDLRFEEDELARAAKPWPPGCVHLYRPGISTRPVEVCHRQGAVTVRLLACSAHEDYALGVSFARVTAELAGAPVRPEDAGGEVAAGELEQRYGPAWAAGELESGARVLAKVVRERGLVTVRGPVRDFHVGARLLAELQDGPAAAFPERLLAAMRRTQYVDPERYYEASPVEVDADDGAGRLQVVVWTPSATGYLFSPVDYVFLMTREKDGGEMVVVPFAAVPEIAGERCVFLDERQLLVEPVSEQDWPVLAARAERHRTELSR